MRKTWAKILLGGAAALLLALALFDWNWLRGPLERYLARESRREVKIGRLEVDLGLDATLRVRDFHVQNAPWADTSRPLIVAGEAAFTFSLKSLWDERIVVSRIVLVDADVDLERQADGLRNWRVVDPDYRGPPKIRVLALEARRTRLRLVNREVDLDVATAASDPAPAASDPKPDPKLTNRIDFTGSYQGTQFSGATLTGALLTFRDSGIAFPLSGHMQWTGTRVDFDGSVADFWLPSMIDAKVKLAGPSLAGLRPFLRFRLPVTRPYRLEGKVTQSGTETTVVSLHGKIGDSDLAGDGSYSRTEPRHKVRAALRSESANLADFTASGPEPVDAGRLFPAVKLDPARLKASDAQVTLQAKKLKAGASVMLDDLRLTAGLEDGVLQLKPFDFVLAGGRVAASVTIDAHEGPISSRVSADLHKLALERLFPESTATAHGSGLVEAQLKLSGRGDSIAALFGSASGSFNASMDRGRISNLADAKLGLNIGKVIALKVRGDHDIDILCGAVAFDFSNGAGRSRALVLDTEQTRTEGSGTLDLRAETLDILLTPRPKNPGLLTMVGSIRIQGPIRHANYSIDRKTPAAPGGAGTACAGSSPASR